MWRRGRQGVATSSQGDDDTRPQSSRSYSSSLVEAALEQYAARIGDPELKRILRNALPNTLDTTVHSYDLDLSCRDLSKAQPRAFIITGDIPAQWTRDSTNQVRPYIKILKAHLAGHPTALEAGEEDATAQDAQKLYRLLLGLLYRQASTIIHHPFANAYLPPGQTRKPPSGDWVRPICTPSNPDANDGNTFWPPAKDERQRSTPGDENVGIWEAKWEVDSLASFIGLAAELSLATARVDFVHNDIWRRAFALAIATLRSQQRSTVVEEAILQGRETDQLDASYSADWSKRYTGARGIYRFQRRDTSATETRSLAGLGEPGEACGLVKSAFRPSDDATVLPFLVPANAQLTASLARLLGALESKDVSDALSDVLQEAQGLADDIKQAIETHCIVNGRYVYETDGYGSTLFMDDANLPSLLSLPYLGFISKTDKTYLQTRKDVLSKANKYFFSGILGEGVGGPHCGLDQIWPMSIIMRALTSSDDAEIATALHTIKTTTAGTHFVHESFDANNPARFSRYHFAWANSLYGELIMHLLDEGKDHLLAAS
ncbi:glycoside hydrolase family 125 protein [Mixia osmundae IAM 14324]|uniref:Glycoside hydrolase family 125 protein n=1 Tax=Mixia osmundae (strain CBS 9802 / IAM 14324 / JCM 22182 / KY 12970) TaxID=764103 RepID=G7DWH9_MIXOS|nr:glycoside hydrolase family 125 protein [Mixia osmundae IAM 14324]KEI37341.1 glycoside hydrolase family 125 protein [Mixia osmundae IAM 14324]GAA94939.1 hypothetical protein E5Q_01594 [Mixia osmundae IAM 14324]